MGEAWFVFLLLKFCYIFMTTLSISSDLFIIIVIFFIIQSGKFLINYKASFPTLGTCAAQLPQLSTEFTYFLQGLNWNSEYNVTTMLQESDIVPGKTYNISTIWSAVKKSIGKNPHLACFNDPVCCCNFFKLFSSVF